MKRTIAVSLAVLALTLTAHAKKPKVYDHTGEMHYGSFNSDAEAHVTIDGHTYDTYCSFDHTSVSCTDTAGAFITTLDDGDQVWTYPENLTLIHLVAQNRGRSVTFPYRLERKKTWAEGMQDFYCVALIYVSKKGKTTQEDTCFQITIRNKPIK